MSEASLHDATACDAPVADSRVALWLRNGLRVAIASGAIGLAISLINPSLYGTLENLVYSECIGFSIYSGITVMGVRNGRRDRPFSHYLLRGLIAVPVGLFVGLNAASLLLGNPAGFAVFNQASLFALPVTLATSVAIMYFLWSRSRIADAATAKAEAERLVAEARLKMLQAQIEPHMLFNTLANLRSLVDVDPAKAQAMIDQLIVYLRGTLMASRSTTTTLENEFAQLRAYLELMKVRMATRLDFSLDLPEDLRRHPMPPMLLQPLVENAIRHGLEPKIAGGTIRIAASSAGDRLTIDVDDDGIGLGEHDGEPGYGLVHVRERLRTLHGDAGRLVIEPRAAGGVRARVELPR